MFGFSTRSVRQVAPRSSICIAAHRRRICANERVGRRSPDRVRPIRPILVLLHGTRNEGWLRTSRIPEHRRVEQRLSLRSLWCSRAGLGSGSVAATASGVSGLVRTVGCGSGCCIGFWSRNHEFLTRGEFGLALLSRTGTCQTACSKPTFVGSSGLERPWLA